MDKNKLKLTVLLLFAVVPISLATWYFSVRQDAGSVDTTNKGVLVVPVLDITDLGLLDTKGQVAYVPFDELVKEVTPEEYKPRPWQLIYLGQSECDEVCVERLYFLRQMHIRLGKESDRVERVYVNASAGQGALPARTNQLLGEEIPDLRILAGDLELLQEKLARTVPAGTDPVEAHYIYVTDPVGNVMMYFTPANTIEEIFSDIDKLLDRSSLG